jgi:hypothetical protein
MGREAAREAAAWEVGFGSGWQSAASATWRREEAEVLVRRRRQRRCAWTHSDSGAWRLRTEARGHGAGRTRGAFMALRNSSATPGSQSGCGTWRLGH